MSTPLTDEELADFKSRLTKILVCGGNKTDEMFGGLFMRLLATIDALKARQQSQDAMNEELDAERARREKAEEAAKNWAMTASGAAERADKAERQAAAMKEALEEIKQVFDNSRRAESKGSRPYDELFSWTLIQPFYDAALADNAGADLFTVEQVRRIADSAYYEGVCDDGRPNPNFSNELNDVIERVRGGR